MKKQPVVKILPQVTISVRVPQAVADKLATLAAARQVRPSQVAREWLSECAAGVRR